MGKAEVRGKWVTPNKACSAAPASGGSAVVRAPTAQRSAPAVLAAPHRLGLAASANEIIWKRPHGNASVRQGYPGVRQGNNDLPVSGKGIKPAGTGRQRHLSLSKPVGTSRNSSGPHAATAPSRSKPDARSSPPPTHSLTNSATLSPKSAADLNTKLSQVGFRLWRQRYRATPCFSPCFRSW